AVGGIVAGIALLATLAAVSGADAQRRKPKVQLTAAVVHVLDAAGAPVAGIEVELFVTRGDGSADRRRGISGADGAAAFDDVRADCVDLQARALLAAGRVDGKLRPCGDGLEAFVVLPSAVPAPVVAAAITIAATPYDGPAVAAPAPEPPVVEPVTEPAAPPDPEPTATPAHAAPIATGSGEGPVAIGARVGIGLCQEWFYRPGADDPKCTDVSPGLDLELDVGWHVTDWLVLGPRLGYGFFESKVRVEVEGSPGSQTDPQGGVAGGDMDIGAANHRLHWGLGGRVAWIGELLVAGVELMPLALLHHFTRPEGAETESYTEFVVSAGVFAGLRLDRSWWLGAEVRFVQPLPWVDDRRFLPGTLALGLAAGYRFGRAKEVVSSPVEAEPAEPEPAQPADPALERRKRFVEAQQDRGGF
ncbi:MAG TPA: hypothetical protein VM285_14505, partial [Polyangia bacterium]|nr:hypothetical protein [Polyangia bacterium]